MIYTSALLILLLSAAQAFTAPISMKRRRFLINSVPEWLQEGEANPGTGDSTSRDLITVRFINTVGGKDVTAKAEPGANLMVVGDSVGVKLPRACRTGLCGSCTCEMADPLAIKTATNPRDGFATIRACSVKCFVPEGMEEMVIDVYRMSGKGRQPVVPSSTATAVEEEMV
jgi:ferredoxin